MKAICTRCGSRVTSKRSRNTCPWCDGRLDYPARPHSHFVQLMTRRAIDDPTHHPDHHRHPTQPATGDDKGATT